MSQSAIESSEPTATVKAEPINDSGNVVNTHKDNLNAEGKDGAPDDWEFDRFLVFVMNLPVMATQDDIQKHFETVSPVSAVYLMHNRFGCFCRCATVKLPDIDAYKAALKLTGSVINDQTIKVIPHKCMINPKKSEDQGRSLKIMVSGIPKSVGFLEGKCYFYAVGRIDKFIPVVPSKHSSLGDRRFDSDWAATITARAMDSYENLLKMDGILIGGRPVKVEPAVLDDKGENEKLADLCERESVSKKRKLSKSDDEEDKLVNSLKLVVTGDLPVTVTSDDILQHMQQAGEVTECRAVYERTIRKFKLAYVIMADKEGKQNGLKLSGSTLMNTVLKIQPYCGSRGPLRKTIITGKWLSDPNVVIASNIPPKCNVEDIKWHFILAGKINRIGFPVDRSLRIAYLVMEDQSSYENILKFKKTFMDHQCIEVMELSSKRVPDLWKTMKTQYKNARAAKNPTRQIKREDKRKKRKLERRMKRRLMKESLPKTHISKPSRKSDLLEHTKPSEPLDTSKKKEIERLAMAAFAELEARTSSSNNCQAPHTTYGSNYSYTSNSSMVGRSSRGYNMNAERGTKTFGQEPRIGGYGQSSFRQSSSDNDFRMHERSGQSLEELRRKEIEQDALAALSELEARKSISNIHPASNTSYGSNYSHTGNTYDRRDISYGRNNNAFDSRCNKYDSYSLTGNYGPNSSYKRDSSYGAHSGFYSSSSSYYQRK